MAPSAKDSASTSDSVIDSASVMELEIIEKFLHTHLLLVHKVKKNCYHLVVLKCPTTSCVTTTEAAFLFE